MVNANQRLGVLIVDYDPNNVLILKMYLENDYLVFTATDGVEGWEYCISIKLKLMRFCWTV